MDEVWNNVEALTTKEALKLAWSKRPPKIIGFLVQVCPQVDADDDNTYYFRGAFAAKIAGFSVANPR